MTSFAMAFAVPKNLFSRPEDRYAKVSNQTAAYNQQQQQFAPAPWYVQTAPNSEQIAYWCPVRSGRRDTTFSTSRTPRPDLATSRRIGQPTARRRTTDEHYLAFVLPQTDKLNLFVNPSTGLSDQSLTSLLYYR